MSGLALLWVVGLLLAFGALSWWLHRLAGGGVGPEGIEVKACRRLDAQHTVWILEVEGKRVLVGSGKDGLKVLSELDE